MTKVPMVPEGYLAVTPWVIADGAAAFIDFLVAVFDAREVVRMHTDDGTRIVHAEVRINDAPVMIFDSAPGWPKTSAYLRVYVDDCAGALHAAQRLGARIVTEPTDLFFGDRVGRFSDPWGNLWWVHTRVTEPSADDLASGATTEAARAALQYVGDTLNEEMSARGAAGGHAHHAEKAPR